MVRKFSIIVVIEILFIKGGSPISSFSKVIIEPVPFKIANLLLNVRLERVKLTTRCLCS